MRESAEIRPDRARSLCCIHPLWPRGRSLGLEPIAHEKPYASILRAASRAHVTSLMVCTKMEHTYWLDLCVHAYASYQKGRL